MKIRIFNIIIFCLFALSAKSQHISLGLNSGAAMTAINSIPSDKTQAPYANHADPFPRLGLSFGLAFNVNLNSRWFVASGLRYKVKEYNTGVSGLFYGSQIDPMKPWYLPNSRIDYNITSLELPVNLGYILKKGKTSFYMDGGLGPGYFLERQVIWTNGKYNWKTNDFEGIPQFSLYASLGLGTNISISKIDQLGIRSYWAAYLFRVINPPNADRFVEGGIELTYLHTFRKQN